MEKSKLTAFMLAVIAALLVMWAGKSCTKSINETNRQNSKTANSSPEYVQQYIPNGNTPQYVPIEADIQNEQPTTEYIEYVTDLIGRVVGTVPPAEYEQIPENIEYEVQPAEEITTEPKSILEQYNENSQKNQDSRLSGYHEGQNNNQQEMPPYQYQDATFPPDLVLHVN